MAMLDNQMVYIYITIHIYIISYLAKLSYHMYVYEYDIVHIIACKMLIDYQALYQIHIKIKRQH